MIVEAPFIEELSGMAIIKVLDMILHTMNVIKLKFVRNKAILKITNNINDVVMFDRQDMIGILDIRSLGYYKVKQDVLQRHLGEQYHFELAENVCDQFNRFQLAKERARKSQREISLAR